MNFNLIIKQREKFGNQRDWFWHGWHIRYTFERKQEVNQNEDIPVLLLHGFGASLCHWRHNIPVLKQRNSVYALDFLGFGASEKTYTNYGIDLWSELVYDFCHRFIGKPCIIVGNSIGSLIGLNTVVKYPSLAKALVMISLPDINGRREIIPSFLQPFLTTLENLVANPLLIRLIFYLVRQPSIIRSSLKVAYVNHHNLDEELINIISQPPQDKGAAKALIAITKSVRDFSFSVKDLLPQVNIPMLLLWGKCDRIVPPLNAEKLVKLNPLLELKLLENLGHCLHDEAPESFHQNLFSWLQSIDL